jgi:hypothetical protein
MYYRLKSLLSNDSLSTSNFPHLRNWPSRVEIYACVPIDQSGGGRMWGTIRIGFYSQCKCIREKQCRKIVRMICKYYLCPKKECKSRLSRSQRFLILTKYIKKYWCLWCVISIIRLIMKYIFMINLIRDLDVDNMFYKLSQNEDVLTPREARFTFFWTEIVIMNSRCKIVLYFMS